MKPVKHFVLAILLVSAFAITTPAGEQDTPGYVAPPPHMTTTDETTTTISSDTDQTGAITTDTSDYLLYEALGALLSVY
jgi:hypothetical protein